MLPDGDFAISSEGIPPAGKNQPNTRQSDLRRQWTLVKQVGFHTVPGLNISDIVLDSEDSLYVLQRSWNSETGNKVALSYVSGLNGAPDVSGVANLNDPKNASEFVKSRQIGELDKLPDLGASAKPGAHQANPLMDNYEGLVITNLDQLATPDASCIAVTANTRPLSPSSATTTTAPLRPRASSTSKRNRSGRRRQDSTTRQAVACHSTSRHSAETIALTTGRLTDSATAPARRSR